MLEINSVDRLESFPSYKGNVQSLKGLYWSLHRANEKIVLSLMNKLQISEITARIMVNRGMKNAHDTKIFLNPKLRDIMPDPYTMLDMDKAVQRVIRALYDEEKITVFADYDVDGATSSALLHKFFADIGENIDVYIPNRFSEGYGPNNKAFDEIKYNGNTLVITVDCGSVAFEPLEHAKKIGLDVIVIDHHVTDTTLPPAVAMLNPNRYDEAFPHKTMAAVGVTFMFLVALRKKLREEKWFHKLAEPDLMQSLDVVALGTICDLMSLSPLNRAFVKNGLKNISRGSNNGISALIDLAKIKLPIQSHHLGYTIGPRINAGGRLDDSSLGFKLLTAPDMDEARRIALRLDELNNERKSLEALVLHEAIQSVDTSCQKPTVIAIGKGWHTGVLGIIASRLKEHYHKTSFIIAIDVNTSIGKGSVRSIPGVDVAVLIQEAKDMSLIIEGGGHAMAGGFSVESKKIETFCDYVNSRVSIMLQSNPNILSAAKEVKADAVISIDSITPELFSEISQIEPFGLHNPKPLFILHDIVIKSTSKTKGGMWFVTVTNAFNDGKSLRCLCFIGASKNLEIFLLHDYKHHIVKLLGTLQVNNMDNKQINFIIEDICI